jgi:3D (Asp-Asp-Asp) domain-containing protein
MTDLPSPLRPTCNAIRRVAIGFAICLLLSTGCKSIYRAPPPAPPAPEAPPPEMPSREGKRMQFEATAYSLEGKTRTGERVRKGIVAADPKILPLGTRIRVEGAGAYSGEYTVSDTGRSIRGREIDIFIADDAEAKRFGRKRVDVEILGKPGASSRSAGSSDGE